MKVDLSIEFARIGELELARWERSDAAREVATAWVDANFPQWCDPSAYWG